MIAAQVGAMIYIGIAVFQCAAMLGAPVGEYMQGGSVKGRLPRQRRAAAAVSALVLVLNACAILGVTGRVRWLSSNRRGSNSFGGSQVRAR